MIKVAYLIMFYQCPLLCKEGHANVNGITNGYFVCPFHFGLTGKWSRFPYTMDGKGSDQVLGFWSLDPS